ncbi:hypothetical protein, partial [Aeromonas veronii]|uniref:hypothetical protein n=1 Tax=Aeromonas veronii TaxID=654 RepID=UPI00313BD562
GNAWTATYRGHSLRISGVAPRANIIAYDACYTEISTGRGLCPNVSTVRSIDQAIADGVQTAEFDPQAAERARQLLAAWAYRYSSQVSADFAHALVLEIAGSRRLFGAWPQLRPRLNAELAELGFRHRMA